MWFTTLLERLPVPHQNILATMSFLKKTLAVFSSSSFRPKNSCETILKTGFWCYRWIFEIILTNFDIKFIEIESTGHQIELRLTIQSWWVAISYEMTIAVHLCSKNTSKCLPNDWKFIRNGFLRHLGKPPCEFSVQSLDELISLLFFHSSVRRTSIKVSTYIGLNRVEVDFLGKIHVIQSVQDLFDKNLVLKFDDSNQFLCSILTNFCGMKRPGHNKRLKNFKGKKTIWKTSIQLIHTICLDLLVLCILRNYILSFLFIIIIIIIVVKFNLIYATFTLWICWVNETA